MLAALAYVLVLAVVALEVPLMASTKQRVDEETRFQARSSAEVLASLVHESVSPAASSDAVARMKLIVNEAATSTRGRVLIVDAKGVIVADSAGDYTIGDNIRSRPEIASVLRGSHPQSTRVSQSLDQEILATAEPILEGQKVIGAVRVTQSVVAVNKATRRALIGLVLVGLAVLLSGLIVGLVVARAIANPITRLRGTAQKLADGDLKARADVEGSSEQRSLAQTFNEMAERLSSALNSQQQFVADSSHQLRTPLAGLRLRLEEVQAADIPDSARSDVEHGLHEVDRLAKTVDELLVLSTAAEPDAPAEVVSLPNTAERLVARWTPYAEAHNRRIELSDVKSAMAPENRVRCAPSDLDRALDALVENAVHYSDDDSVITVTVSLHRLSVHNKGPGLGSQEGDELFERFHRGQAGFAMPNGTGLGLPIARSLAERWDANVSLTNSADGVDAVIDFEGATANAN